MDRQTWYAFTVYSDLTIGAQFRSTFLIDESSLHCDYFAFHVQFLRVLNLITNPQQLLGQAPAESIDTWILIPCHEFGPDAVLYLLQDVGVVEPHALESIPPLILSAAAETASDPLLSRDRILALSLELVAVTSFDEQEAIERAMIESAQLEFRAVPAAAASIGALEKVKIGNKNVPAQECCVVCFEDLADEEQEVVSMPCSHLYHKNCIAQWLKTSHFCPLCRYAMPTETTS